MKYLITILLIVTLNYAQLPGKKSDPGKMRDGKQIGIVTAPDGVEYENNAIFFQKGRDPFQRVK